MLLLIFNFVWHIRIFSRVFREPDAHLGYIFNLISAGTILSSLMVLSGILMFYYLKKK